jgi:hypothetical protein
VIPLLPDYERARHRIETSLGGVVNGRFIFCGYDVTHEIAGVMTQTEAICLWLLGRKPAPMETRLLDTLISLNVYPDIRIWSLRAGAFAQNAGAPVSSACAASHASHNGALFGVGASLAFRRFLARLADRTRGKDIGKAVDEMVARKTFFPGFGRPLIRGPDERVERLSALLKEWKYPLGPYTLLFYDVARRITAKTGLHPNFASIHVALLMDPPFALRDSKIVAVSQFIINIAAIAPICEIADRETGSPLLPLRIDDVDYKGAADRKL